jgi:hypothetical protein
MVVQYGTVVRERYEVRSCHVNRLVTPTGKRHIKMAEKPVRQV